MKIKLNKSTEIDLPPQKYNGLYANRKSKRQISEVLAKMKKRQLLRQNTMPINKQETEQEKQYRETVANIANNIMALTKAVSSLVNGPLKKKALVVLLANSSGQSQQTVNAVLTALEDMGKDWLNR